VARRTGESPRTIAALGFGPLADLPDEPGDGPARLAIVDPTAKRLELAARVLGGSAGGAPRRRG